MLPEELAFDDGDTIRLALDGDRYHAVVETNLDGEPVLSHVADNRRLARERDGTNRLAEWVAEAMSHGGQRISTLSLTERVRLRTPGSASSRRDRRIGVLAVRYRSNLDN